jgi:ABC-type multidrug transport system ATPase subunit
MQLAAVKAQALELLRTFGMEHKASEYATTLSGGTKRKLNLMMALVGDPTTLVLDEPTAGDLSKLLT